MMSKTGIVIPCFLGKNQRDYIFKREFLQSDSFRVRKRVKIRNQYNQVPHLTKDTT